MKKHLVSILLITLALTSCGVKRPLKIPPQEPASAQQVEEKH